MENIIRVLLISGFFIHIFYWIYLLKTKDSEKRTSRKRWGSLVVLISFIALFQLIFPDYGRFNLFNNNPTKMFGLTLFLLGTSLSIWAKRTLGKNWTTGWEYQIKKDHELVTNGPFKFTRNPIYCGLTLMSLGFELSLSSILLFAVILIFPPAFYLQAKREELILEKHFGEKYEEYKRRTKLFLPELF